MGWIKIREIRSAFNYGPHKKSAKSNQSVKISDQKSVQSKKSVKISNKKILVKNQRFINKQSEIEIPKSEIVNFDF